MATVLTDTRVRVGYNLPELRRLAVSPGAGYVSGVVLEVNGGLGIGSCIRCKRRERRSRRENGTDTQRDYPRKGASDSRTLVSGDPIWRSSRRSALARSVRSPPGPMTISVMVGSSCVPSVMGKYSLV